MTIKPSNKEYSKTQIDKLKMLEDEVSYLRQEVENLRELMYTIKYPQKSPVLVLRDERDCKKGNVH